MTGFKEIILGRAEIDAFLERISPTPYCWYWTGQIASSGYGILQVNKKVYAAHRVSQTIYAGAFPSELEVDHMCHVRSCVNPEHLRAVTKAQNLQNKSGAYRNNISGERGVHFHKATGRWRARVGHKGKVHYLGLFDTKEEASEVSRAKRVELFTHNNVREATKY